MRSVDLRQSEPRDPAGADVAAMKADNPVRRTAEAFAAAVRGPLCDLPLPAGGRTRQRWLVLSDLSAEDLSLGRLAEGHADAIAILAELGGPSPASGNRWGVWAAQPPGSALTAQYRNRTWYLSGTKQYCSGARACTHALVTANAPDGYRLFALSTDGLVPVPGTWPAVGMAGSDTLDVRFDGAPAVPVGAPGSYLDRPGFAYGGAGVAACWFGGARAIGQTLLSAATERDLDPHSLAHLGAVDTGLYYADAALERAADEIDADPADSSGQGSIRSMRLRALIEAVASDVMSRVGRALGAGPLCHDAAHSRRVADLTVYLRQHHAERSFAELGSLAAERGGGW